MKVSCPDCKEEVKFATDTDVGEILECSNCGAEMELLSKKPTKVEILEEEK